jgi:hypothetical protein
VAQRRGSVFGKSQVVNVCQNTLKSMIGLSFIYCFVGVLRDTIMFLQGLSLFYIQNQMFSSLSAINTINTTYCLPSPLLRKFTVLNKLVSFTFLAAQRRWSNGAPCGRTYIILLLYFFYTFI